MLHKVPLTFIFSQSPNVLKPVWNWVIFFRPFYSVVSDEESPTNSPKNPFENSSQVSFITESNYRTLMSEMMLSVRIRSPVHLQNRTVGQHVAQMDWMDSKVGKAVQVYTTKSSTIINWLSWNFLFESGENSVKTKFSHSTRNQLHNKSFMCPLHM